MFHWFHPKEWIVAEDGERCLYCKKCKIILKYRPGYKAMSDHRWQ